MKNKLTVLLLIVIVISGIFFTVGCSNKKANSSQPASIANKKFEVSSEEISNELKKPICKNMPLKEGFVSIDRTVTDEKTGKSGHIYILCGVYQVIPEKVAWVYSHNGSYFYYHKTNGWTFMSNNVDKKAKEDLLNNDDALSTSAIFSATGTGKYTITRIAKYSGDDKIYRYNLYLSNDVE